MTEHNLYELPDGLRRDMMTVVSKMRAITLDLLNFASLDPHTRATMSVLSSCEIQQIVRRTGTMTDKECAVYISEIGQHIHQSVIQDIRTIDGGATAVCAALITMSINMIDALNESALNYCPPDGNLRRDMMTVRSDMHNLTRDLANQALQKAQP
jgi:hypothetical protein